MTEDERTIAYWYGLDSGKKMASDTDNDGYTLAQELQYGMNPHLPNVLKLGGVTSGEGPLLEVILKFLGYEFASGLELSDADKESLKGLLSPTDDILKVVVQGVQSAVELGLDLGIKPKMQTVDGVATATFELPTLKIVGFDVNARKIRAKIVPAAGAEITQSIVSGVIHVYGTDNLNASMTKLSDITVNATEYLGEETKGDVLVEFDFGTKTFFKVIAGRVVGETLEAPIKDE